MGAVKRLPILMSLVLMLSAALCGVERDIQVTPAASAVVAVDVSTAAVGALRSSATASVAQAVRVRISGSAPLVMAAAVAARACLTADRLWFAEAPVTPILRSACVPARAPPARLGR